MPRRQGSVSSHTPTLLGQSRQAATSFQAPCTHAKVQQATRSSRTARSLQKRGGGAERRDGGGHPLPRVAALPAAARRRPAAAAVLRRGLRYAGRPAAGRPSAFRGARRRDAQQRDLQAVRVGLRLGCGAPCP